MDYPFVTLSPNDRIKLRVERLSGLESELVRALLELEETPGHQKLLARVADLGQRMNIHREALGFPTVEDQSTEDVEEDGGDKPPQRSG